ncbi:unnamed protein product [Anisakis simplex]|uniref:G_PROTEIN_RECEP_F1_2 domain-containing protein n=1 Tax=Anisakis simplex TaxID=6269 RepID=A0A0M3KEX8_ANISI|nr:unnamed protein product [Anisakis simplex]
MLLGVTVLSGNNTVFLMFKTMQNIDRETPDVIPTVLMLSTVICFPVYRNAALKLFGYHKDSEDNNLNVIPIKTCRVKPTLGMITS